MQHHFVEALGLAQKSEQTAIGGFSCAAVRAFDQKPGLHSSALEMRRNREGYGQLVVPQSGLEGFWVVLFPKNLQQPARCNPDFKCFLRKVDPIDETFEYLAFRRRLQVRPAGGKVRGQLDNLLPSVHIIEKRFDSVEDFTLAFQEDRKPFLYQPLDIACRDPASSRRADRRVPLTRACDT